MSAHYVYRVYDDRRGLIYVGVTRDLRKRLRTHSKTAWWAPQAKKVVAKVFPDRTSGLAAESAAIRDETPRWNIRGKGHLTDGWRKEDFVTYISSEMRGRPLTEDRLLFLHILTSIYKKRFRAKCPVVLPYFDLAEPAVERTSGAFIARLLANGGWLIEYGGLPASLAVPGDQMFEWVEYAFVQRQVSA
jgi:predicted GIY-YIG superfamily endonuclease